MMARNSSFDGKRMKYPEYLNVLHMLYSLFHHSIDDVH